MVGMAVERIRCAHSRLATGVLAAVALVGVAGAEISYSNFNSTEGLNLMGFAATASDPLGGGSDVLRLTPAIESKVGAVWARDKFNVTRNWESSFRFRVSTKGGPNGLNDLAGADGFAFVIQNASNTAYASNSSTLGGGVGYNQLGRLVAVEFDTWMNERAEDPNANHISIQAPGVGINTTSHQDDSRGVTTLVPDMSDGTIHMARLTYIDGILSAYIDQLEAPALSVAIDLGAELGLGGDLAYVGFTSSTGGCWEEHDLYDWSMQTIPAPASAGLLALGGLAACRRRRR